MEELKMRKMLLISLFFTLILIFIGCDSNKTTSTEEEYVTYSVAVSNDVYIASVIYNITITQIESDSIVAIDSLQQMEQSEFYSFQFPAPVSEDHQINVSYIYNDETINHTTSLPYDNIVIHVQRSNYILTNEDCRVQHNLSFINETASAIDSILYFTTDLFTVPIYKIENLIPNEILEISVFAYTYMYDAPISASMAGGQYFIQSEQYDLITYHVASGITFHIKPFGNYVTSNMSDYEQCNIQFINENQSDILNIACSVDFAAESNYFLPQLIAPAESSEIFKYYIPTENTVPNYTGEIQGHWISNANIQPYSFTPASFDIKIHILDDGYWVEDQTR
jgi:hypothetical protein